MDHGAKNPRKVHQWGVGELMREITQKTMEMLAANFQCNPQNMLKVDIDPPFVGTDFQQAGSDPSLSEYDGSIYLTLVDAGAIKVAIVEEINGEMKVTGLLRQIAAAGAGLPKLTFEPSTYAGLPALPHVAYQDTVGGRAMVYREEYDAQGNVETIYDEIGIGKSCGTVLMGTQIIDFYIGVDGVFYSRFQHQYAEAMISPQAGGAILWADAKVLPDGRFIVVYIEQDGSGNTILKATYSQIFGELIFDDNIKMTISTTDINLKQVVFGDLNEFITMILGINSIELMANLFQLDESIVMVINTLAINLLSSIYNFNESIEMRLKTFNVVLLPLWYFNESINMTLKTMGILLTLPYYFNESIQMNLSTQALTLF